MNELIVTDSWLPTTPQELIPFVAVGTAAVNAARKALKTNKLTKEQFDSILAKGQEQGKLVFDVKAVIGAFINNTPSANGKRTDLLPLKQEVGKTAVFTEMGLTQKQASNYQLIAKNPNAVLKAMEIAKENNDIATESLVLQIIKQENRKDKKDLPKNQNKPRTWNFVYQSRLSFANENKNVVEVFEIANNFEDDDSKVEFFHDCIKACKRAIEEMGY